MAPTQERSTISAFVPRPTTTSQSFLAEFWSHTIRNAENYRSDFKDGHLPLARIKKLVKADPDIKMIAHEVTVLLDKACEIFINEITVRSFLVANSLNRRTVNLSDVAMAISQSDMFDFLIDIVPTEQAALPENTPNNNQPATSAAVPSTTSTRAATTNKRRQVNHQDRDQSDQQHQSGSTSQLQTATASLPTKKKVKKHKVNPNLLPEEVAVPIPDEELIPPPETWAESSANEFSSAGRLLAIPIPDSELIPPRASRPPWEMAVPITSNDPPSFSVPPPTRTWELAVPILDPSTSPTWEMAVPILDHESSYHPSIKRKRNWELAVPIIDENEQDHRSGVSRSQEDHPHPSTSFSTQHQQHHSNSTKPNQPRTWELAVPIIDDDPPDRNQIGGSSFSRLHSGFDQLRVPHARAPEVPIDPALFDFGSPAKVEPELIDPQFSDPRTHSDHLPIKQED